MMNNFARRKRERDPNQSGNKNIYLLLMRERVYIIYIYTMLLNMNKSYMCDGVCTIIMDTCNQIKLELMERNDPNTMIIYYPYRRGEKNLMEMMDIL